MSGSKITQVKKTPKIVGPPAKKVAKLSISTNGTSADVNKPYKQPRSRCLTNAAIAKLFARQEELAMALDDGLENLAGFLEELEKHLPPIEEDGEEEQEDGTDTASTEELDDGSDEEDLTRD